MRIIELTESRQSLSEAKEVNATIALIESIIEAVASYQIDDPAQRGYDNGIDFKPQPHYKGVQGINHGQQEPTNSNDREAQHANVNDKLNKTWATLIHKMKKYGAKSNEIIMPHLYKLAAEAKRRGFSLEPDPSSILG